MYSIDLFAGAGGLTLGLEMAGFKSLYANEISPTYSSTLSANNPEMFVETGDIRSIDAKSVRRSLQLSSGELTLLAGGPPCQGFSVNAPIRSADDERNHLFRDYLRFVEEFMPELVLMENVPGIISFENGATVAAILEAFSELGYRADVRVLFAPHYGIPQMRWRTIFIASRTGVDPLQYFPAPTHIAKGRANFTSKFDGKSMILDESQVLRFAEQQAITVSEAIGDLPEIGNGGELGEYKQNPATDYQIAMRRGSNTLSNHRCAKLGPVNTARLLHIPPGGSWRDIPFDLLPAGMKRARRSDHTKRYGRLHPDGQCSTILTKCDPHWGSYIHYAQDRVLSVREAARIQSFPDRVEFMGSITEQYEQVGNAVPPLFAKAIGERIKEVQTSNCLGEAPSETPWISSQLQLDLVEPTTIAMAS